MAQRKQAGTMTVSEMGRLGGHARAAALSPQRRQEIGRIAGHARAKALSPQRRHEIGIIAGNSPRKPIKHGTDPKVLQNVCFLRGRGWTYAQIAASLGVTRAHAMRLFREAYERGFWEG